MKDSHKILLQGQLFGYTESAGRVSQVALVVKNQLANEGDIRDASLFPGLGRFPRGGQPILVFSLGESHGQWSLVG